MLLTDGYQSKEILYSSQQTIIYRGSNKSGEPVILKVLNDSHPDQEQLARFRLEYEMVQKFKRTGSSTAAVIQAHELVKHHNSLMIVLEEIAGDSLSNQLKGNPLAIDLFLPLACQIATILEQVHEQLVIHKDINPANIIWNPATNWVRIIDFGISEVLSRESMEIWHHHMMEGTPAYISPEQTGRMNRSIDFRTDLYALGATFYFMLSGSPPFTHDETVELVHCHLARQPFPLHEKNMAVPVMLSRIVDKLLAKEPEQRYQTVAGLKRDLLRCLDAWQRWHRIEPFLPGQADVSERFTYPQQLFGRKTHLDQLERIYTRTAHGSFEVLFITGEAGVGKSALVHEFSRQITLSGGYFIAGKFNQGETHTPYKPIVDAFRALIQQFLTESDTRLALWKSRLLQLSEARRSIVSRMIPELEVVYGSAAQMVDLPPQQLRDQFQLTFLEFVKAVCHDGVPLVLFIDDLQWADVQSLQLLERMIATQAVRYCLLILASRDMDADSNAYFKAFGRQAEHAPRVGQEFHLAPLASREVNRLITQAIHCSAAKARTLTALCMEKTHGNPFFLKQFLNTLYVEKLLFWTENGWSWDEEGIRRKDVTENVADLIIRKIRMQKEENQEVLQIAACFGMVFDLKSLSLLSGHPATVTMAMCQELVKDGFIRPLEGKHQLGVYLANSKLTYQFVHDRVHQVTYALIEAERRVQLHLKIGRLLHTQSGTERQPAQLLQITDHLNSGVSLLSVRERLNLTELNLQAGRQAMQATAHNLAFDYFLTGIKTAGPEGWHRQYSVMLQLHDAATEVAYVAGQYGHMLALVEAVKQHARQLTESIRAQENLLVADTSAMKFAEALHNGLQLLVQLGLHLPEQEPDAQRLDTEWRLLDQELASHSLEWFVQLAPVSTFQAESVFKIISSIVPVAAILGSRWMPFLLIHGMRTILQHGHSAASSIIVCDYAGLCLCGIRDDVELGHQFGQAALRLLQYYPNEQHKTRLFFMYTHAIRHWKEHYLHTILPSYKEGIQSGLEVGDLQSVSYLIYIDVAQSFFFGKALPTAEKEVQGHHKQLITINSLYLLGFVEYIHQALSHLMHNSVQPCQAFLEKLSQEEEMQQLFTRHGKVIGCNMLMVQLMLRLLFRQHAACGVLVAMIRENLQALAGNAQVPVFLFLESLFWLATYTEGSQNEQLARLANVDENLRRMRKWLRYGAMNLEQLVQLVDAERFRVLDQPVLAQNCYNRAIEAAKENGFSHIYALAFELAGQFYLLSGVEHLARYHLSEAAYAYSCWGAHAKVVDIEGRFPGLLLNSRRNLIMPEGARRDLPQITAGGTTTQSSTLSVDLPNIIKASQAISSEMDYPKLVQKLLQILMENAGATQGSLIAVENGELDLLAAVTNQSSTLATQQAPDMAEAAPFSREIVLYVLRTKEFLVLDDARYDYKFSHTEYVRRTQARSILCLPLFQQEMVNRIIYLENNLLAYAFSHEQIEALRILGAQASISLTNAKVLNDLKSAENELLSSQQQLRNLSRHQQLALESEQKKISQVIHDELGSILTRIRIETELFLGTSNQKRVHISRADINDLLEHIDHAMTTIRRIASVMRPKSLDQCGLLPALLWQANQFKNLFEVQVAPHSRNIRLDEDREITMYRIGQEAITNVARHAAATLVEIYFDFDDENIILSVSDNGCGMLALKKSCKGMGIQGMKERAQQLSGTIAITPAANGGLSVTVTIPRQPGDRFEP
ncbi:MAG: AAA family ATPase [Magnetococcales bacterium]|nr:AAA family ATPase [Magnetococcales bacterium]MBF0116199.1 AAA family ATPase [Magnetococcales bacterium]